MFERIQLKRHWFSVSLNYICTYNHSPFDVTSRVMYVTSDVLERRTCKTARRYVATLGRQTARSATHANGNSRCREEVQLSTRDQR